jgi:hypothetical protein
VRTSAASGRGPSSPVALQNRPLSPVEQANDQLDSLRAAIDARLSTLEAVLTDPTRGESLEELILDLARAVTAEARAASEARLQAEQEAEVRAAQAQVAAEDAVQQSQAVISELHRAVELARERIATLEREKEMELASARETLEAQAARERESFEAQAARERESIASLQRNLAEARSQLERERAAAADLRRTTETSDEQLSRLRVGQAQALAKYEQAQSELESAKVEAETARKVLAAARERIQELDRQRAAAEQKCKDAEGRLETATRAQDSPAGDRVQPQTNGAARHAAAAPVLGDERWAAVRLADRFRFSDPIEIHINGEPGLLFDLSVAGCQVMSWSMLKPNHVLKVLLPTAPKPLGCAGKVMWARLEQTKSGRPFGYRAGLQFIKPDTAAIEAFLAGQPKG